MTIPSLSPNRLTIIPGRAQNEEKCGGCQRTIEVNQPMFEIWKGKVFERRLCQNCNARRKKGELK